MIDYLDGNFHSFRAIAAFVDLRIDATRAIMSRANNRHADSQRASKVLLCSPAHRGRQTRVALPARS